ncbi:MAG: family 16 glycosylhydrolase [Calditrichaeota bacterium]|nr:family 16 glycosylhydrolase [Calditrichota bacterium]
MTIACTTLSAPRSLLMLVGTLCACLTASAQVGELLWEESFDDLDNWIIETGNGNWGWGNGELEFYSPDNVEIVPIPGEPGNNGLRITARAESGPGIVDQWGNPLSFTSGRISSKSFVSIQYGMVEVRVRVPDLDMGGWPAIWMLGTSNLGWPANGEIDLMEMGWREEFRDLHDSHNGGNGLGNSTVNQVTGGNALWEVDGQAANLAWDPDDQYCRPYYRYDPPLTGEFMRYRLYWDDSSLRFVVVDGENEIDLYTEPFQFDADAEEFLQPFYMILNMAIGGQFTDAATAQEVSMPLPAELLVDYIHVYSWNGMGRVSLGPPTPESGRLGLYTETTPVTRTLVPGEDSEIYVWEGTLADGSDEPWEGENVLSWQTTGAGWFGAGIMSVQPLNLFDFGDGWLNFRIRIPANVSFRIGIIDGWGNQNYVDFPGNQTTWGLVRDGNWGQAQIPTSALRGQLIDLRMLSYGFVILEVNGAACNFALDDIYWDAGETAVQDPTPGQPIDFGLTGIQPNPFNPSTRIDFQLPAAGRIQLTVHDLQGRRLAVLADRVMPAGAHRVNWTPSTEASGMYFIRLESESGRVDLRKCLYVK